MPAHLGLSLRKNLLSSLSPMENRTPSSVILHRTSCAVDAAIPSLLTISSSSTGPCPSMYLMTLHLLPSYAEPSSTMPGRLTLHESPTVTSGLY